MDPVSRLAFFRRRASTWLGWLASEPAARQRIMLMSFSAIVGLLAHVAFLLVLPSHWQTNQSTDYVGYYRPVAENLVSGKGLVLASKPALTYPPGLPLLYAATFWISDVVAIDHAVGLRILQGFFVVVGNVLVGLIGMLMFSMRVALTGVVLWSTYPFQLWLTKQPDASAALTALLLSAVVLFLMWTSDPLHPTYYGLALGGVLATAALLKPFCIALPVVFACLVWACEIAGRRRRRWTFSILVVIAYVCLILPWEIWARRASGQWIPLCTNGPNALIDGLTFGTVRGLKQTPMPEAVHALAQDAVAQYQDLKTTSSIAHFLITQARERPLSVVELFVVKAIRSWYGSESHSFEKAILIIQLCYLPFVIFGARRAWKGGRKQRNFVIVAVGIVTYFWAMTVFTALPILRYIVPAISLLIICAASASNCLASQVTTPPRARQNV
jgi:hypothetical protein